MDRVNVMGTSMPGNKRVQMAPFGDESVDHLLNDFEEASPPSYQALPGRDRLPEPQQAPVQKPAQTHIGAKRKADDASLDKEEGEIEDDEGDEESDDGDDDVEMGDGKDAKPERKHKTRDDEDDDFDPDDPDNLGLKPKKPKKKKAKKGSNKSKDAADGNEPPKKRGRGRPKKDPNAPSKPKKAKKDDPSAFALPSMSSSSNSVSTAKKPQAMVQVPASWQKQMTAKLQEADKERAEFEKVKAELAALKKKQSQGMDLECSFPGCEDKLRGQEFLLCAGCDKAFCTECVGRCLQRTIDLKWVLHPPHAQGNVNNTTNCPNCRHEWEFPFKGLKVFPLSLGIPSEAIWDPKASVKCPFCPVTNHPSVISKHLLSCNQVTVACPFGAHDGSCTARIPIFKLAPQPALPGKDRELMATAEIEAAIKNHTTTRTCTANVTCMHPRCHMPFKIGDSRKHEINHTELKKAQDKFLLHAAATAMYTNIRAEGKNGKFEKRFEELTAQSAQLLRDIAATYNERDDDVVYEDQDLRQRLLDFCDDHRLDMSLLPDNLLPMAARAPPPPLPIHVEDDDDDVEMRDALAASMNN